MKKVIDWLLPIRTVSEANASEHWAKARVDINCKSKG